MACICFNCQVTLWSDSAKPPQELQRNLAALLHPTLTPCVDTQLMLCGCWILPEQLGVCAGLQGPSLAEGPGGCLSWHQHGKNLEKLSRGGRSSKDSC